jgi:transcription elongation factor GreA
MSISAPHPKYLEDERVRAPDPTPRVLLTRAGEEVMRGELKRLRERIDGEFTARLREAREFGGSSENDEYLQILEEEAVVAARIRRLENLLASADIVEDDRDRGPDGIAGIGSLVEVRNTRSGAVRKHRIAGGFEPAEPGDVSANSPVGEALLGRAAGDIVEVGLPSGRRPRLEILAVESTPAMAQPDPV